jgi:hypothetical protein
MIQAQRIAEKALADILGEIRPGITEKEIAALLLYKMLHYGAEDKSLIARPALHSYHLRMLHPVTGAVIDVTAPLPEDIQRLLKEERL